MSASLEGVQGEKGARAEDPAPLCECQEMRRDERKRLKDKKIEGRRGKGRRRQ